MSVRRRNREARAGGFAAITPRVPADVAEVMDHFARIDDNGAVALPNTPMTVEYRGSSRLNYPGDRRAFDPDWWVGPDMWGAVSRPVFATYDAAADRTTIQFTSVTREQARERLMSGGVS